MAEEGTEINQLTSQDPQLSDVIPYSKGDLQTVKTTWQKVKDLFGIQVHQSFTARIAGQGTDNPTVSSTLYNDFNSAIVLLRQSEGVYSIACNDWLSTKKITCQLSGVYSDDLKPIAHDILIISGKYVITLYCEISSNENFRADIDVKLK